MSVESKLMTAEELWELPEKPGVWFELVNGELVEMPGGGGLDGLTASAIAKLIDAFAREHELGRAVGDGVSFIIRRDPDTVRVPDASYVSYDRIPAGCITEAVIQDVPDIVVEVVSPYDNANEIHIKVRDYLEAGAPIVWVVWPATRSVTVSRQDGSVSELHDIDELNGGEVLPGFRVPVAQLFDVD